MLRSFPPSRLLFSSVSTLYSRSAPAPTTNQLRKFSAMAPPLPKLNEVIPVVHPKGVLELRLNTPKNLNAFGGEKYLELIKGFDWARDNDDIKAVVV